jgi:hypothetical protein
MNKVCDNKYDLIVLLKNNREVIDNVKLIIINNFYVTIQIIRFWVRFCCVIAENMRISLENCRQTYDLCLSGKIHTSLHSYGGPLA